MTDLIEGYVDLDPHLLHPLHPPTNSAHLDELTRSMEERGWHNEDGEPERALLVVREREWAPTNAGRFLAQTGSHRIAAAIEAELETVPCYVIDANREELRDPEFPRCPVEWLEKLLSACEDYERRNALNESDDEEARQLMWLEDRS